MKETLYYNFVLRRKLWYSVLWKTLLCLVVHRYILNELRSMILIPNTYKFMKFLVSSTIMNQIPGCLMQMSHSTFNTLVWSIQL